jgi:charged multivesicular body protein 7
MDSKVFIYFFTLICVVKIIYGEKRIGEDSYWDDLRVTFGNPKTDFQQLPRENFGKGSDFVKLMKDESCDSGKGMFQGYRYWANNDSAVILLFDKNGYIAGMQTAVPAESGWVPSDDIIGKYVLNDTTVDPMGVYTLTAYFVEPTTICSTGRNSSQFKMDGTGTDLYIQTGMDPKKNFTKIPEDQDDIKETLWGHGKCYYQMGQHYWYDIHKDMSCDHFVPYCLLYNRNKLNAFCFAIPHDLERSDRYEHPTLMQYENFFEPVPNCFYTDPSYHNSTTMHVYFTSDIADDKC